MPDPELLAHIAMTQSELDALRKQLTAVRDDNSQLQSDRTQLQQTNSEQSATIVQLQATVDSLKKSVQETTTVTTEVTTSTVASPIKPATAAVMSSAPVATVSDDVRGDIARLEAQLQEKREEVRELESAHRKALREIEKEKRSMERDLTKALRSLAKSQRGAAPEVTRLNDLLNVVAAQTRAVHVNTPDAARDVERRLAEATQWKTEVEKKQEAARNAFEKWEVTFAEVNGREASAEDACVSYCGHHSPVLVIKFDFFFLISSENWTRRAPLFMRR